MKNAVQSSASAFQRRGSSVEEWGEAVIVRQYQLVLENKYGHLH
jgi:hypothetical protein